MYVYAFSPFSVRSYFVGRCSSLQSPDRATRISATLGVWGGVSWRRPVTTVTGPDLSDHRQSMVCRWFAMDHALDLEVEPDCSRLPIAIRDTYQYQFKVPSVGENAF